MWQHMTTSIPGKQLGYFDVEGETRQICVYWSAPPACADAIEVTGVVFEVRGAPKRPGGKESKVDDSYAELSLDVASTRCVD